MATSISPTLKTPRNGLLERDNGSTGRLPEFGFIELGVLIHP